MAIAALFAPSLGWTQTLPSTAGETLSGKSVVLAEAVRGHSAVLIAGFSKDAGTACGDWAKAVRGDQVLAGIAHYQVASLEQAPGFVRGMIKNSMRKGLSAAEQDHFVILTQDEKLWRGYFSVGSDKEPYVVLLDAKGDVLWHGHGLAKDLEPSLSMAAR
jgi:hypothetical protein